MPIDHWMMFATFAEQRHFIYPSKQTYQGVIINGNMVAHAPDGLAAFILERTDAIRYIINPITHAFQHDPSYLTDAEGNLKSSIHTLVEIYGEPLKSIIGRRPVLPRDLRDDTVFSAFVKRCLEFQDQKLAASMAQSDVMKYLEFDASTEKIGSPYALVPPFFYITETSLDEWLPICVRAAHTARELYPASKIFAAVVVSQGVVSNQNLGKRIAGAFRDTDISGYLLWIDSLDEQQAGESDLRGLLELARSLRQDGAREVINLYGGYFSIMSAGVLGNYAMSGVTHGPEFGEYRPVVPVGGGLPIAKYYIPQLHARVRYRDTVRILNAKGWLRNAATFHANVCDCEECRETLNGDVKNFRLFGTGNVKEVKRGSGIVRIEYPTTETKVHCLQHYLQRKKLEYQFAATAAREQILTELQNGYDAFEEVIGLEGVSHLKRWAQVLR